MDGDRRRRSLDAYRNLLIAWRLLKRDRTVHYSSEVPTTRWGDAINRLLAERSWNKRQLADAASIRPNTLTNMLTHGRDSDTATLGRIAAAFGVDLAELFLTKEQSVVLAAHQESRIERLKDAVVKELSETVTRLVAQELERGGQFTEGDVTSPNDQKTYPRPPRRKRRQSRR